MTSKKLEEIVVSIATRLAGIENKLQQEDRFRSSDSILALNADVSTISRELNSLKQTLTGHIRIETERMFKRVMTERDLFAFRLPVWARFTRKIKNIKI